MYPPCETRKPLARTFIEKKETNPAFFFTKEGIPPRPDETDYRAVFSCRAREPCFPVIHRFMTDRWHYFFRTRRHCLTEAAAQVAVSSGGLQSSPFVVLYGGEPRFEVRLYVSAIHCIRAVHFDAGRHRRACDGATRSASARASRRGVRAARTHTVRRRARCAAVAKHGSHW